MRLWPRVIRKTAIDAWEKDLGPSRDLLTAFRAGKVTWEALAGRYREEVSSRGDLLERYCDLGRRQTLTLLCSCPDETHCHRSLLKGILEGEA